MIPAVAHPQEEARLAALRRLSILDTPPEERFDRLSRIAMEALGTPMASVSLIDADRQWCKSSPGMAKPSVDRAISFCGHTVLQETPLIVPDATKDNRFHDNPLVTQNPPNLRSYIGIPLRSEEGFCVGSFCVLDTKPREFTPQQIEIVSTIASVVEKELQNIALNKSLEEARVARKEAEAALAAKSAFLAMMSHEIRTPLNGVLGIADMLHGTELSKLQQEYVNLIRMSGNTLLALINDILDVSKIESGSLELESLPVPMRPFIQETLALYVHAAQAKGISLTSEVQTSVPEYVTGDPFRLRQILINLVGNALKFTKCGEVKVLIGTQTIGNQQRLVFRVSDTGAGIAPENLQRLFKPYSQADTSTTRQYGGTGLGLSICKLLVGLMGGAIRVESELGKGATFIFEIPCLPCETPTVTLTADPAKSTPAQAKKREDLNVLVVEDNPINQRVATLFLKKLGCKADCAPSGEKCLEKMTHRPYDIIFMDVHMTGMSGYATTREIRKGPANGTPQPWVVALTASSQNEDAGKCSEAGMDDFLTKPLRLEALNEALEKFEKTRG